MTAYLFNILMKLKAAKDLLVAEAPGTIRSIADVLGRLEEGARSVAAYIEQLGTVQYSPGSGGGPDSPEVQQHLLELASLRDECEAVIAEVPAAVPDDAQAALGDRWAKLSPEFKKLLLSIISQLIGGVLLKSGQVPSLSAAQKVQAQKAQPPTPKK